MTSHKTFIVKRTPNYTEAYDERKLYASVYAACLCVKTPVGEAELTAAHMCKFIGSWLKDKQEVTSHDIRCKTTDFLKVYNPDAAYMYSRHRLI